MSQQPLDRSEFEAALSVRKDFGPEMEPALIESSAEKVVAEVRRQQTVDPEGISRMLIPAGQSHVQRHNRSYSAVGLAIASVVLAIPSTAITLAYGGTLMGMVVWTGVVSINFTAAPGNFRFNDLPSRWRSSSS